MGLSEDATKQITDTYGKQTEEKIGRVNGMTDALKTKMGELNQSSFQSALTDFQAYFSERPIENYTGTEKEQMQLDELVKRFHSFFSSKNRCK